MTQPSDSSATIQDAQLQAKWDSFLNDYCKPDIQLAAQEWDMDTPLSFTVSFDTVQLRDPDLADYVLLRPRHALQIGALALNQVDVTVTPRPRFTLRIDKLPNGQVVPIRKLRAVHMGRLVAVEGIVKRVSESHPCLLEAVFECKVCTTRTSVIQETDFLEEPVLCETCEKKQPVRLLEEESRWFDWQRIELQESPEGTLNGQGERIHVGAHFDLVHRCNPGDRVRINGIPETMERRENNRQRTNYGRRINAVTIEVKQTSLDDVKLDDAAKERARALVAREDFWDVMHRSVAPLVIGHEVHKKAILLTVVGAPTRETPDGQTWYGHINTLLVGDSGVAKSRLLKFGPLLSPRSVFADGANTTGVGLSASAVKDDWSGAGGWSLEAGALVLADGGLACIDEMDKMDEGYLPSVLEALQDRCINVNKASISQKLHTRCSVLMAANPVGGRFDPYSGNLADQIGFVHAIVTRCDLIFGIRNVKDVEKQRAISTASFDKANGRLPIVNAAGIPLSELRELVALARTIKEVELTSEAFAILQEFYLRTFKETPEDDFPITPRYQESLNRICMAHARLHLREKTTVEDAKAAVAIMLAGLVSFGLAKDDGSLTFTSISIGTKEAQANRIRALMKITRELCAADPEGCARLADIQNRGQAIGMVPHTLSRDLDTMVRNNQLYHKKGGETFAPLV
jgi:replicative DNA helicase Mcm